ALVDNPNDLNLLSEQKILADALVTEANLQLNQHGLADIVQPVQSPNQLQSQVQVQVQPQMLQTGTTADAEQHRCKYAQHSNKRCKSLC
ncbi:unnamed protein product, partial [Rotaria magnacalcarata]